MTDPELPPDSLRVINEFVDNFGQLAELEEMRIKFESNKLHHALIQELLWDMAYDLEMGYLSPNEKELYELLSSAWLSTSLRLESETNPRTILNEDQTMLFLSRLEEKLDQRLDLLPPYLKGKPDPYLVEKLQIQKRNNELKLHEIRTQYIKTISSLVSTASQLFSKARAETQPKLCLHAISVLKEQAECLLAQSTHLNYDVEHELRKPSTTLEELRKERDDLKGTLNELRTEIAEMTRVLSEYHSQDAQYHKLLRRYKECQEQLAVHCELLAEKETNTRTTQPTKPRQGRRSLSLSSLPPSGRL